MKLYKREKDFAKHLRSDLKLILLANGGVRSRVESTDELAWLEKVAEEAKKTQIK